MSDIIERVARAIVAADTMGSEAQARAAIAAMREPTDVMVRRAVALQGEAIAFGAPAPDWRAMIDAALAQDTQGDGA